MSATKPTDVNSELPDQDALAAFATSALGPGRRRRDRDKKPDTPAATADASAAAE